jgi:periodic tryptophan protein 1
LTDSLFVTRVKRGAAQQNPQKYILDDQELERVSALARIELEDAKAELQRAQEAANAVEKRVISGEDEDANDDGDNDAWVE